MKPTRIIPLLTVTAACALGTAVTASADAATNVSQASSANWSGYVVGGSSGSSAKQFKSVSGSWIAPTAKCTGGSTYSAFWVGLGGAGQTEALEQAGTEANCSASGQASYYAWYELVPSAPVTVDLAVHPGDHISTRVTADGTNVAVSVSDQTTGQTFSKNLTMSSPDVSSAEWVAEAPSSCDASVSTCTPLSLTDFGTVSFTSSSATTTDGHTGSISDPEWSAASVSLTPGASSSGFQGVDLSSGASSGAATPSTLSSDGGAFSVAYSADSSGTASGTGGAVGQGDGSSGSGYGYTGSGYGGDGYGYGYGAGGSGYGAGGSGYGAGGSGYGGYGSEGYGYGGYGSGAASDGNDGFGGYDSTYPGYSIEVW